MKTFSRSLTFRRRAGFSLIESMIATAILSLGFLGTVSLITFARVQNDLEQERARAHQIVTEKLEEIQRDLYTFLTPGSEVTIWDNGTPDNSSDDTTGQLEVVARDSDGNTVAVAPNPAIRLVVEVTLTWNPRGRLAGKTMRETAMTYIAP